MSRPALEVAQIFRHHGPDYRKNHGLSLEQHKAMRDIERCRTARLGGHVDVCSHGCGYSSISYNSCRNRHCPKCQSLKQAKWLAERLELRPHGLCNAKTKLEQARALIYLQEPGATDDLTRHKLDIPRKTKTWQEMLLALTGLDLTTCPQCGKGRLIRLKLMDRIAALPPAICDSS